MTEAGAIEGFLDRVFPADSSAGSGTYVHLHGERDRVYGYHSPPGAYRLNDRERLRLAIGRVGLERDVRLDVGLRESTPENPTGARGGRAHAVFVRSTAADPDRLLAAAVPPSYVIGSLPGREVFVGWVLDRWVSSAACKAMAEAMVAGLGPGFEPVLADGGVRPPGSVDHARPANLVSAKVATGLVYDPEALLPGATGSTQPPMRVEPGPPERDGGTLAAPAAETAPAEIPEGVAKPAEDPYSAVHARLHDVEALAGTPDILGVLRDHVRRSGYAGPTSIVEAVFLIVVSRLFEKPGCIAIRAGSSAGKSFSVDTGLKFVPPSAFHALTSTSEKALLYTSENLSHRVLVRAEAEGLGEGFSAYTLRSLLSEGRVRHEYVDFEAGGTRVVETEGPTGLILTTTKAIEDELNTRLLTLAVPESQEQTREVILAQARRAAGDQVAEEPDVELFQLLHLYLEQLDVGVVVPYAVELAELVDVAALRMRRDFQAVLCLIRAHALLHQATRPRDGHGRVEATLADYCVAYELIAPAVAEAAQRVVPEKVRHTVEAVGRLGQMGGKPVTTPQLTKELGLDGSAVRRRITQAVDAGYLMDKSGGRNRARQLVIGDPLPEDRQALPTPAELEAACSRARTPGEPS